MHQKELLEGVLEELEDDNKAMLRDGVVHII